MEKEPINKKRKDIDDISHTISNKRGKIVENGEQLNNSISKIEEDFTGTFFFT